MGKTKKRAWRYTVEHPRRKLAFKSGIASHQYQCTCNRALFMERGFTWSTSRSNLFPETVNRVIQTHKWETFCQNPVSASISLVHEFYANYDPTNPDSYVRGKRVEITPSNINSLFSLPNHYNTSSEAASRDILKELTKPGTRWTRGSKSNGGLTFPRESLKAGPRIWFDFMRHKLVPCCKGKLVRKDHAVLLYRIMVGEPINVGEVISKEIRDCASMNKGDLWFPSLITQLCKQQNVVVSYRDPIERPFSPLDVKFVEGQLDRDTSSLASQTWTDPDESWHDDDNDDDDDVYDDGDDNDDGDDGDDDGDEELLDFNENGDDNNDDGDEELLDVENGDDNNYDDGDGDDDGGGGGGDELLDVNENGDDNNNDDGDDDHHDDEELLDVNVNDDDQQTSQSNHDTSSSQVPLIAAIVPPSRPPTEPQTDSDKLFNGDGDEERLDVKQELGENVSPTSDCVAPPQNDIICVQGYKVKQNLSPILESIFKKHGDIASKCVFKTPSVRSLFLEIVCEIVRKIQTADITNKMEEIERHVSEAEAANINVSWIRAHLETVYKENNFMKKSSLLMEMKVNTVLVKNAARIDLRESCEELMCAQELFQKAERCVRVLHLVEKSINDNILKCKAEKESLVKRPIL